MLPILTPSTQSPSQPPLTPPYLVLPSCSDPNGGIIAFGDMLRKKTVLPITLITPLVVPDTNPSFTLPPFYSDPNGGVIAFADMMRKKIVMPAHLMDDGEHAAKNSGRGLFDDFAQASCRGVSVRVRVRACVCVCVRVGGGGVLRCTFGPKVLEQGLLMNSNLCALRRWRRPPTSTPRSTTSGSWST